MRVLLVTNIPTPYRLPLFSELNKAFTEAGITFKVAFGAQGYSRRKWKVNLSECAFDHVVLSSRAIQFGGNVERTAFSYRGLYGVIKAYAPDVIITPGFSLATMRVFLLSLLGGARYLIWSGSVLQRGRLDSRWRIWQRKMLVKRAMGGIAYGSKAKEYFQSLGMPEDVINIAINTVDTEYYRQAGASLAGAEEAADKKILTFIGYLSARKHVHKLLDVIADVSKERSDFVLEVIGDGDELDNLKAYAKNNRLAEFVSFVGYKQKAELPRYLARSSGLLFQTGFDIWGLVLNEAMAAGIPCLASIHAGATHDLIDDGVTGFSVDFSDRVRAKQSINWILDHPDEAAQIGRRASRYIAEHASLQRSAAGFVDAVLNTCREYA